MFCIKNHDFSIQCYPKPMRSMYQQLEGAAERVPRDGVPAARIFSRPTCIIYCLSSITSYHTAYPRFTPAGRKP